VKHSAAAPYTKNIMAIDIKKSSRAITRQTCSLAQAIYRDTVQKTDEEVGQDLLNAVEQYEQACKQLSDSHARKAAAQAISLLKGPPVHGLTVRLRTE